MSKVILGNVARKTKPNRVVRSPTSATEGSLADASRNSAGQGTTGDWLIPTGTDVGDRIYQAVMLLDNATGVSFDTVPSGWTLDVTLDEAFDGIRCRVWSKEADGTEVDTTFTTTGTTRWVSICWLRNGPTGDRTVGTVSTDTGSSGGVDPNPVTVPASGTYAVDVVVFSNGGSPDPDNASAAPTNYEFVNYRVQENVARRPRIYVAQRAATVTTSEDPGEVGWSDGTDSFRRYKTFTIATRLDSGAAQLATGDHTHTESDVTDLDHWTESDHDLLDHTGLTGVGSAHTHEGAALSFDAAEALSPSDTNHYGFPGYAIVGDVHVATWRQGASHVSTDGVIRQVRSTDGGVTWGSATTVYSNASYDAREAILTKLSDDRLVMAVGVQSAADGSGVADGGFILISSDSGATWGSAKQIDDGGATDWSLVSGQVLELENGDWITAITVKDTGEDRVIRIIKTDDDGDTWTVANTEVANAADHDAGLNEAGLVRQGSTIVLIFRDNVGSGFGYRQWRRTSTDGGVTWTTATQVLDGYGGSPRLLYRENGQIVVILRDSPASTYPPVVLSSDDLGLTWSEVLNFSGDYFAYGQPAEDDSGVVHAVYSIEASDQADAVVYYRAGVDPGSGTLFSHADLPGLLEDDHTQYSRVDGSRAFTGTVSGVTPTADAHLATKAYVDSNTSAGRWEVLLVDNGGTLEPLETDDGTDWLYVEVFD